MDDINKENHDVELNDMDANDQIELGLLKLAMFGVAFNQPNTKFCLPCGKNSKPTYDEKSWVKTSKLRRTNGELVRHDAESCLLCKGVLAECPHGRKSQVV